MIDNPDDMFKGSRAEAYMLLARMAISLSNDEQDLRSWWGDEQTAREEAALNEEQQAELVTLSKRQIEILKMRRLNEKPKPRKRALI